MTKNKVNPRIVLSVRDKDYIRWNKTWKRVRNKGIFSGVIGRFLLDKLAESEKDGFRDLIKYIEG